MPKKKTAAKKRAARSTSSGQAARSTSSGQAARSTASTSSGQTARSTASTSSGQASSGQAAPRERKSPEAEATEHFTSHTPRPVLETLFPKGAKIGGKKVFPLTLASHCFLEELGNPSMSPGGIDKMTNRQMMELCFVLTHPLGELVDLHDELIVGDDRSQWDRAVLLACQDIPLEELQHIGQVIGGVIMQATQTMVPTQPKKKATS